ncbi:MAG TPA: thiamine-phosphate kinase [Myxococcota bacterium]|nr:thiamine-phosphate kinase [Myxococcota bacterium]
MQLRDLGEFGLIARIARAAGRAPAHVAIGIGDDAAVLRARAGEEIVVTTDAFVERVHFRFERQSARHVGRFALAACLSDLAAMGARPLGVTAALAAPPRLAVATADALTRGLLDGARRHHCPLVGGNVTRARETSLTLTAVGAVAKGRALTRRGTRAGDRVLVTGVLGAAALARVRADRGRRPLTRVPEPRLRAGRALARTRGVVACIDVSDGLAADLAHLLGPRLRCRLDPARLPVARGFQRACRGLGLDWRRLAQEGGEDYELLFTVRPPAPSAERLARRLGLPVREIGVVERGAAASRAGGFRHF